VELLYERDRRHLEGRDPMTESTEDLITEYRSTAIAWDIMQNDANKANPLFKRLHIIYKDLRVQKAGRDAITAVMDDPTVSVGVRLVAAGHSLGWEPRRAIAVLETIEREGPGLNRTTAKYTLKAFREGTLNLDW
jgi:hypothetical protein